ncbi:EAL domain-containing protein [Iamia sp.]|uniref:EAL domain-containing protein n=1 Tax=Iamia sp. TaxID=2722710 RepID=UPI002D198AD2|nr:EAL domain-containing protein [Iamia sp.]HXH58502.1 EAL domain-containing protein [Iamia sp.]
MGAGGPSCACATHAAGHRLDLAVNLSARQLADPGLADDVERAIVTSGIDPGSLVLEVTETALMEDPDRALATLQRLRRIGARIAVDDFGTGYCSLSYLSAFPVQILKVDAAFVARMTTNQQDRTIVAAVIGLAHALGIMALGEGVESESQLEMLSELGCDAVQGFLLGVPLPGPELLRRLEAPVPVEATGRSWSSSSLG